MSKTTAQSTAKPVKGKTAATKAGSAKAAAGSKTASKPEPKVAAKAPAPAPAKKAAGSAQIPPNQARPASARPAATKVANPKTSKLTSRPETVDIPPAPPLRSSAARKAAATGLPAVAASAGVPPAPARPDLPKPAAARVVVDPYLSPMPPAATAVKADPKLANAWKTKAGRELSEPEVLAMPEDEYMNDKQLEFFRVKLEQLKNDLLSNADETTEHLREDTSIVPDPADRATIEEEHALELRTRDRERKLLKKISQALARIEAGEYGYCDETGEPIGLARLIARPTATLTLEAQQRRELKQKLFGD